VTAIILLVEVVGAILTNSLALLADAGHMASDIGALGLSLAALWLATRPPSQHRTYGFHRAEVLAALLNSLILMAVAGYVFWEASRRLADPPDVRSGPMLAIATIGLAANLVSAALLFGQRRQSLNVRAAFLHVVGDAAASVGVIVAGVIMLTTGQFIADPAISVFIGTLILAGAFRLTWETTQVLLEATPPGLSIGDIQQAMLGTTGVHGIHDFHVWTVTSGFVSLSAHVETDQAHDQHDILVELRRLLAGRFGIEHATIQLETSALHQELEACCGMDSGEGASEHAAFHG
jgi:cobalt-zinc-cadmium efflux system protein